MVVLLSILKTLFEGRLGWIGFPFTIPRTILGRLSGGLRKIFWTWRNLSTLQRTISERKTGVERKIFSLPYNQRTLFRALSEKSFEGGGTHSALSPKDPFTIQRAEWIGVLRFCLADIFLSTLQRTFFLKNLAPLSKNFSCSWFPLYLAKWIRDRFCPRFLKKVSRTERQALRSASNCPFYFPTDKMMRSVTALS